MAGERFQSNVLPRDSSIEDTVVTPDTGTLMQRAGIQHIKDKSLAPSDYASNSNFSHIVSKVELDAIRAFPDRKSRFIK